jgi:tetratricopeptide (TPR) repeat protein
MPAKPPIVGHVVDADELPAYRLPLVDMPPLAAPSDEWPAAEATTIEVPTVEEVAVEAINLPLESPAQTLPEANADILPVPVNAQSEMINALESIWSESEPPSAERPAEPSADSAHLMPYTPTVAELSQQLLPSVRQAYGLAQRGALFAAQAEFIQVLRRIAQAKDIEQGTDEHSQALAAGLRALDEADDFMPAGVQLEAEMNVEVVASSHRTPVPDERPIESPHEAIALYHQYAQQQLGRCVAGERAGSMALYGLGKIYLRLAHDADDELRQQRKAMAMFRAALVAGPENHLAANEIGVLLARSGHPAEAAGMFRQAIDLAPLSGSYHNLATVERKLGQFEQANANAQYAEQLAARDRASGAVSRAKGVQWVAPQDLARASSQSAPMQPVANAGVEAKSQATRPVLPRGPSGAGAASGSGDMSTAAKWPQKLVPGVFRR